MECIIYIAKRYYIATMQERRENCKGTICGRGENRGTNKMHDCEIHNFDESEGMLPHKNERVQGAL